jgi:hypothetical protein
MKTPQEKRDVYWNPIVETLPLEKLRDLRFKKFNKDYGMGL